MEIHKTKPLDNLRSDPILQEIVYKMIPELYFKEQSSERSFKEIHTEEKESGPSGQLEEDDSRILVTLKYFRGTSRLERIRTEKVLQIFPTRYLCCPSEMPVGVLKKFVLHKFDLSPDMWTLDLWRGDETLLDNLVLRQLVQIYGCYRERKPLELHFSLLPNFPTSSQPVKKEIPLYKRAIPPLPKEDPIEETQTEEEGSTAGKDPIEQTQTEEEGSTAGTVPIEQTQTEEESSTAGKRESALEDVYSQIQDTASMSSKEVPMELVNEIENKAKFDNTGNDTHNGNLSDINAIGPSSNCPAVNDNSSSSSSNNFKTSEISITEKKLDEDTKNPETCSENHDIQMAEEAPQQINVNEDQVNVIPSDEAPPDDKS